MLDQSTTTNSAEIDKALKQFEVESQAVQPQKIPETLKTSSVAQKDVEGIKFEVPSYGAVKYYQETETPKMVKLVIKWSGGAIKEQKQAEYILLAFVVLTIGVSVFLFLNGGRAAQQKLSPELLQRMKQIETSTNH